MENKKYTTAGVSLALGMSEVAIKEMFENAKELTFTQIIELSLNSKIKRYTDEANEIKDKLDGFAKLFSK